jgi:hypothetical protein
VGPEQEYSARLPAEQLRCFLPEIAKELSPLSLSEVLPRLAEERQQRTWAAHDHGQRSERRARMRGEWRRILGQVELVGGGGWSEGRETTEPRSVTTLEGARAERYLLTVEPGIRVPMVLLLPEWKHAKTTDSDGEPIRPPVVLALSQAGKQGFFQHRSHEIVALLADGIAVCLCDLRGTGESSLGEDRGRTSAATAYSSSEQMLGGTLVGARLRDARSVLAWLRTRDDLDASRIALWGDSFVSPQSGQESLVVPRDDDGALPVGPEPLGGLVALLAALFEEDIDAVFVRSGISEFGSVLGQNLMLLPHDVVVPGIVAVGDVPELLATLAPCSVALRDTVDGVNRRVEREALREAYRRAIEVHEPTKTLTLEGDDTPASWLREIWRPLESR